MYDYLQLYIIWIMFCVKNTWIISLKLHCRHILTIQFNLQMK